MREQIFGKVFLGGIKTGKLPDMRATERSPTPFTLSYKRLCYKKFAVSYSTS